MAHQNLLTSGLRASVARTPHKLAIKSDSGTRTYSELADRIDAIKCMARHRWKLNAGDVVALISPNCIEYFEYISALAEVGVAVATVNYRLSALEAQDIILDSGAKLIVYHQSCEALVPDELERQRIDSPVPVADGFVDAKISEETVFAIPYTSGTTGRPKGVMISHRSRVMTFYGLAAEYPCFSSDCYFLAIAPLCHGAGFAFGYAPLHFGGTVEILPQFDAEQVILKLAEGKADGIFMVPAHFQAIFSLDKEILESVRETHSLKSIISNASALPQPLKKDIVELFGADLLNETYGSTEAGIVTNLKPKYQMRKLNCVGTPFVASEVSLRDESGQEVSVDTPGELVFSWPCSFHWILE
jgi:long-chain acyl-CoA synthetase